MPSARQPVVAHLSFFDEVVRGRNTKILQAIGPVATVYSTLAVFLAEAEAIGLAADVEDAINRGDLVIQPYPDEAQALKTREEDWGIPGISMEDLYAITLAKLNNWKIVTTEYLFSLRARESGVAVVHPQEILDARMAIR